MTSDPWLLAAGIFGLAWLTGLTIEVIGDHRHARKVAELADALHRDLAEVEKRLEKLMQDRTKTRVMPLVRPLATAETVTPTRSSGRHARPD